MNFEKYIERIKYLDAIIRKKRTGSPSELAAKLNISRAQLYNHIDYLKDLGLPIEYCRKLNTFYYSSNSRLEVSFSMQVITEDESKDIQGGQKLYYTIQFL
jgi:biotin operon repressor